MACGMPSRNNDEPTLITKFENMAGKTIVKASQYTSNDGKVKILQVTFSDNSYCLILADNPSVGVHLFGRIEKGIPENI